MSLENKNQYSFSIDKTKIIVDIDVLNPFIEIDDTNDKIQIINPKWHLIISYYAYIDAMTNHDENIFAKKIKEMPGHPSNKFSTIKCKSLSKWIQEAF